MVSKPIRRILYATNHSGNSVPIGDYAPTIGRRAAPNYTYCMSSANLPTSGRAWSSLRR